MKLIRIFTLTAMAAIPFTQAHLRKLEEDVDMDEFVEENPGQELDEEPFVHFNSCDSLTEDLLDDVCADDEIADDSVFELPQDDEDEDILRESDDDDRALYSCPRWMPKPQISYNSSQRISGYTYRYWFNIHNNKSYPSFLWKASPHLPACGLNKNSARSWVNIYRWNGRREQRVYGYCALTGGLPGKLWVALDGRTAHYIRIKIDDRGSSVDPRCGTSYWLYLPRRI